MTTNTERSLGTSTMAVPGADDTPLLTLSRLAGPGDRVTVLVRGDVDSDTAPSLRTALMQCLGRWHTVTCDLESVAFLGAAGVNVLLESHRYAETAGRTLALRGAHGMVRRVLAVTGVDAVLPVGD
jgi:anti-anti-sigma factor